LTATSTNRAEEERSHSHRQKLQEITPSSSSPKISKRQDTEKKLKRVSKNIWDLRTYGINIFFKRDDKNGKHLGSCNIQCLNAIKYKKFRTKTVKVVGKHVEFTPHHGSLDGANARSAIELTRLGFSDVNNALANTIKTLDNIPGK
jgi:hypothetical protein